jgi:nitrite reductase/ring-hydroxylating ferredoxin subunit
MALPATSPISPARRRALATLVNTLAALLSGGLAALLGAFTVNPGRASAGQRWFRAGAAGDLVPNQPTARILSVPSQDGWYRARTRQTVFLVRTGERSVRALSATCTHLGCQVQWDGEGKKFRCPCHGGAYDLEGRVVEGPPPRPLAAIEAHIDDSGSVLVQV